MDASKTMHLPPLLLAFGVWQKGTGRRREQVLHSWCLSTATRGEAGECRGLEIGQQPLENGLPQEKDTERRGRMKRQRAKTGRAETRAGTEKKKLGKLRMRRLERGSRGESGRKERVEREKGRKHGVMNRKKKPLSSCLSKANVSVRWCRKVSDL